jgi:sugar lactone lactonase YvrE
MSRTITAEVALGDASEHAENPLWDARRRALLWTDQHRGLVRESCLVDGALQAPVTYDVGRPVGAIAPHAGGGWVVAAGADIRHLSDDGSLQPMVEDALPHDGPLRRWNDGKADPGGRFWVGTTTDDGTPGAAALYVLEGGRLRTALDDVTQSNGLGWAPGGDRMFYNDTATGDVARLRVRGSAVERDGVVVHLDPEHGLPDGLTVDAEGCVWVALWSGGGIERYAPDGELLLRVDVGARQVSSCCFGGDDLGTLYITTSAEGYDADALAADPDAGRIFAARPGVAGLPADAYAG